MNIMNPLASNIDVEKYRLRRFVERLVDMDEVETHDEPVPLTGLGAITSPIALVSPELADFKRASPAPIQQFGGKQ